MADNWLKPYHFSALQLPRRDLHPTDVVYRDNGAFEQKVGALPMLFASARPLPATSSGEPSGTIARSFEKKVELSVGAKILGALFGGGKQSTLGTDLKAKHADSFAVTYEDVTQDSIAVLDLQGWLEQAQIQTSRQATGWLNDEKLAAVTAVLRTTKLSISAQRSDGGSIELNIPTIEGLVGGNVQVSADSANSARVTFSGQEPIVFGFQAFIMNFEGNVSFGLEQLRRADAVPADPAASAWTAEQELETVTDRSLPKD